MSQALDSCNTNVVNSGYAQFGSKVSVNPLTEAEYNELYNLLQTLIDHINSNGMSLASEPLDGSGKLVKLSIRHLMELASDMCDELERRATGSLSPLPSKSELSDKRNNARMRMAAFPFSKLNGLILDVAQELDKEIFFRPFPGSKYKLNKYNEEGYSNIGFF